MNRRYVSKESNKWLRTTMLKLCIKSLDELPSIAKIDRGSISRYFNSESRQPIDAICAALEIKSNNLLIDLGAKARNLICNLNRNAG